MDIIMAIETPGTPSAGVPNQKNKGDNFLSYGLSNPLALFLGGAFLGIDMLLEKFLAGKFGTIHTGVSIIPSINLISEIINALFIIIVLGYLMVCIREMANGNYRMPSIAKNLPYLRSGIGAFAILVIYVPLAILILYIMVILLKASIPLLFSMCILLPIILGVGLGTIFLLIFSAWISIAFYANDGDLFLAINPIIGVARSLSHINLLITVIVQTFIIGIPLDILSFLYKLVPFTEVLSPWARFYALTAATYIAYDFYRHTDIGKVRKSSTLKEPDR